MWREQATPTTLKSMFGGTFGAHGLMAIVCASFLLSGCAIDLPIEPEPSVSIRPTEPPEMPDAAKGTDEDAAIAFAKHYIDVLSYSARSGDTDYLRTLSSDSCEGCLDYINLYEQVYKDGGYFKRGDWTFSEIDVYRNGETIELFGLVSAPATVWKMKAEQKERHQSDELYKFGLEIGFQPEPVVVAMFNVEH